MTKSIDDYKKYKRITVQPDELIIIDCPKGYEVVSTNEKQIIYSKGQIKIDCREIK
jgi:hypothetical protein